MIGRLAITEPVWDEKVVRAVEEIRARVEQEYAVILKFGLYGFAGDWPEARLYAGYQCLRLHPDEGSFWLDVARLHEELREFDQAEAILREVKKSGGLGLFASVFYESVEIRLAYLLLAKGRLDEAHEALQGQEAQHGDHPLYRYLLGSLLHQLAFHEEAVAQYDRTLRLLRGVAAEDFDAALLEGVRNYVAARKAEAAGGQAFSGLQPLTLEELGA